MTLWDGVFRAAHEFKLDPRVVAEWPDGLLRLTLAWLKKEMNVPSRTDHHILRIAEVVNLLGFVGPNMAPEKLAVTFRDKPVCDYKPTKKHLTDLAMVRWNQGDPSRRGGPKR